MLDLQILLKLDPHGLTIYPHPLSLPVAPMPDSDVDFCKARMGSKESNNSIPDFCKPHKDIIKPIIRFIIAFDVLHIFGLISIIAILCTACFSSRIRRSKAWYSFTATWALSFIGYLLILGHQTGPLPGPNLCLFQAMLTNAFPVLNALTFVALLLEMLSGLFSISRTTMMVLYFLPYGVFTGILIEVFILGHLNPTTVQRKPSGMFCYLSIRVASHLASTIVICAVIAFLILGGCIIVEYRRQCWSARNNAPFSLVLRVGLVGICSILAIGFRIFFTLGSREVLSAYSDLSLAVLQVAVAIIFGSQKDLLCVWMFWRKLPETLPTPLLQQ